MAPLVLLGVVLPALVVGTIVLGGRALGWGRL